MAYLLDSDVVIAHLTDEPSATALLAQLAPHGVAISVITYLEVYEGIVRSPDPPSAEQKLTMFLARVPILPLSLPVARRCARLRDELRHGAKRVRARAFDLVIAATALEHGYELVTRNLADYADIPRLRLYQAG